MLCRCGQELTAESKKYSDRECLDCFIANESASQKLDREFDAIERIQEQTEFETEIRERDNAPWVPDSELNR